MQKENSSVARLLEKKTPWTSIACSAGMLFLAGLQISAYFTSTWQYITFVSPNAQLDLFGWVIAACSLGAAISSPIFGYWNQRTLSTKQPLTVGFGAAALGNTFYALLPLLPLSWLSSVLLISRFLTGFGTGTLGILRSFIATASTQKDRVRAVSLGTSGLTAGLSLGPALQICFLPLGIDGFSFGPIILNVYTSAAFSMALICVFAILLTNTILVEDYAGIISDDEKKEDPFIVIPKYDRLAVALLFFYWWIFNGISSTEGLAAPITMAMYNWSSEEAVLYNGILQTINCTTSTLMYIFIGTTRFGKLDRRYHLALGMFGFLLFHSIHLPWQFYEKPLDRTPIINGTMIPDAGGCSLDYSWCEYTPRVPLYLYLVGASLIMGVSFPLMAAPCNTILSEVLGPRKQGFVQGIYAFTGSIGQFLVPVISSYLFEMTGYGIIMGWHVTMLLIALILLLFLRKRLVPLALAPPVGLPTKYKNGTLYRM